MVTLGLDFMLAAVVTRWRKGEVVSNPKRRQCGVEATQHTANNCRKAQFRSVTQSNGDVCLDDIVAAASAQALKFF